MKKPTPRQRRQCLDIVCEEAKAHGIPPCYVTAHIMSPPAIAARKRAMLRMITEAGLKRCQVAWAFDRDLRRVRASVIGGPRSRHGHVGPDYEKVDLFGQPLPVTERKGGVRAVTYRDRFFEVVKVLEVVREESPTASRLLKSIQPAERSGTSN